MLTDRTHNTENSRTSSRPCPLCTSAAVRLVQPLSFAMFDKSPLSNRQDIVACQACGFVFVDTPSSTADFQRYYNENLYYANFRFEILGKRSIAEMRRHRQTANLLGRHIKDKTKPVVDVGCNNGAQLVMLRENGFSDPRGIDMLDQSVDYIRTLGFKADIGSASELPDITPKPTAYLFSHVLEHIIDPRTVLARVYELLEDDAFVYIEVPDAADYQMQDLTKWYIYLLYEHVNHFDESHLCSLAVSCGFSSIETGWKTIPHRGNDFENKVQCLYGLFQKQHKAKVPVLKFDGRLESLLCEKTSRITLDPDNVFEMLAQEQIPVYVWGISPLAQLMLGSSPLKKCRIVGLLDQDDYKQTQAINGIRIQKPYVLGAAPEKSAVVLPDYRLAITMKEHLRNIGYKGQVIILGFGRN
jgi:hypothetical protein